jgi:hypothetical protein
MFIDATIILQEGKRPHYRLLQDFTLVDYHVPAGFITDGASAPRPFWSVFPPVDSYLPAAIVHDHAVQSGMLWDEANNLFDRALAAIDIPKWRRSIMTSGVKFNGWLKGRRTSHE